MFAPAAMFFLLGGAGSGQNTTRITLDQAIDLALAHNHSLKATRTMILQNQAQEITANLRPNPTLGVDTQFVPFFSPQDFSGDILRSVQLAYRQALAAYLRPADCSPRSACAFLSKFSPLRSLE
jgi:cobalt-zinc-cadmium efflux system outer membrane protein